MVKKLDACEATAVMRDLGSRIRAERIRRGSYQGDFAKKIGISIPTLRDIENGKPTVAIGAIIGAIHAIGRLDNVVQILANVPASGRRRAGRRVCGCATKGVSNVDE